jgi:hypothetical protein
MLLANPIYAIVSSLQSIPLGPVPMGKVLALLVLSPRSGIAAGPVIHPWQATVVVQAVLVAASVLGSIRILRGRRVLPPLRRRGAEPETHASPE